MLAKVNEKVLFGGELDIKLLCQSRTTALCVLSCAVVAVLVHLIVSPGLIVMLDGLNKKLVICTIPVAAFPTKPVERVITLTIKAKRAIFKDDMTLMMISQSYIMRLRFDFK